MEMDSMDRTRKGTRPILRRGQPMVRNRTSARNERLSQEQQLTETIISVGILPTFCILGLVACILFLHLVWRKRGKEMTNHLPIVIAVFDAIYLLLTLEDRIMHSLTNIFSMLGGFDEGIQSSMKRVAKFSLAMGTTILCVHSIEVCHAVLRPMTYRQTWTKRNRFIIATSVIAFGLLFFVSFQTTNLSMDDSQRPILQKVRTSLEDGLFNILSISTMITCYVIIIVKRNQPNLHKSTAPSSRKRDQTNRLVRSLVLAGSAYFLLGVPVDVVKFVLIYVQNIDKKGVVFWAIRLAQNIMEVLYGSVLLFIFILNEALTRKRRGCCACLMRMSTDESGIGSGHSNQTESTNDSFEERAA